MNKKKIYVTGFGVLLLVAFFNIYLNSRESSIELSELGLANIEALAQNEGTGGSTSCTVVGYKEIWSGGCLYNCAQCAEGHFVAVNTIKCLGR